MDDTIGNANPLNGDGGSENPYESLEADELRELLNTRDTDLKEANRLKNDFYIRARKAEGYEPDPNNPDSWIKTVTKTEKKQIEKQAQPEAKKQSGIDYGMLSFFNGKSEIQITHDEDIEFLEKELENSGKPMMELLQNKYFLNDLKERQDVRAVQEATPSSTGRTGTSKKDVNYWKNQPYHTVPAHMKNDVLDAIKEDARLAQHR